MRKLITLLGMLFLCSSAWASTPTVVHGSFANSVVSSGANVSITITSTTAGNLLVVGCYQDKQTGLTPTISDGGSQTYTQAGSSVSVGNGMAVMFYKPNTAGSITTVTCSWATYTGTATVSMTYYEISGAATASPLDGNGANPATSSGSATGTSLGSGTLSTNNANDILLYYVGENTTQAGGGNWTVGSGYSFGGTNGATRNAMQNKGVSATQSGVTTTMSWSSTGGDRIGIFAAFADTPQTGTPGCKNQILLTGAGC